MGKIIKHGIPYGGTSTIAGNISYDNSTSQLNSQTVQNAITELKELADAATSQVTTLPAASAANLNKIYQYIGTTNANYTNGMFYKCVYDTSVNPAVYKWQIIKSSATGNYTPAGTVSQPTFSGTQGSISVSGTPSGTISQPTFTGTQGNISVSGTPSGTVSQPSFTGTEGTISVSASLPTLVYDAVNKEYTWSGGTLTSTGTFTPAGTVSQPTFSGNALTSTGNFTPEGIVSQPTFSGSTLTSTGNFTPSGTVSQPTFTGTAATIEVS